MDFITNLPLFEGKYGFFICIDKLIKFYRLIPVLVGKG